MTDPVRSYVAPWVRGQSLASGRKGLVLDKDPRFYLTDVEMKPREVRCVKGHTRVSDALGSEPRSALKTTVLICNLSWVQVLLFLGSHRECHPIL